MELLSDERLDATFSALADPTRRAILARLTVGAATVTELAEPFAMTQPAISKHIADLEHALGLQLVERSHRDGALTEAGDFVANHVLRAESLLVQAGLGVAQFKKSGTGAVAVVPLFLN